jgi:hypothetical protein
MHDEGTLTNHAPTWFDWRRMPVTSPPTWQLHGDDALQLIGGGSGQHWTPNHVQWSSLKDEEALSDIGHGFDHDEPDVAALKWRRADRWELESHSDVDADDESAGIDADKRIKMEEQNMRWE